MLVIIRALGLRRKTNSVHVIMAVPYSKTKENYEMSSIIEGPFTQRLS